jgi:hypothetical protein
LLGSAPGWKIAVGDKISSVAADSFCRDLSNVHSDDEQLIEGAYESAIDVENTSGMLCLIPKVSFHRTLQKLLGCTPGRYFK